MAAAAGGPRQQCVSTSPESRSRESVQLPSSPVCFLFIFKSRLNLMWNVETTTFRFFFFWGHANLNQLKSTSSFSPPEHRWLPNFLFWILNISKIKKILKKQTINTTYLLGRLTESEQSFFTKITLKKKKSETETAGEKQNPEQLVVVVVVVEFPVSGPARCEYC